MEVIAKIMTDFSSKFGIPRQSGLVEELKGTVIFEPKFRNEQAIRGLDGFSHIWLLWKFNTDNKEWSPTVRPPKLGGNTRVGVFASRSPFRPNSIGLSCVKLDEIKMTDDGAVLIVSGADLMNGTQIVDIKPYVPYADCRTDATGGFSVSDTDTLRVDFPEDLFKIVPAEKRGALVKVLALDPRPSYQNEPERVYGFGFAGFEIKFTVNADTLTVVSVEKTFRHAD